jgi:hypothetical protein
VPLPSAKVERSIVTTGVPFGVCALYLFSFISYFLLVIFFSLSTYPARFTGAELVLGIEWLALEGGVEPRGREAAGA